MVSSSRRSPRSIELGSFEAAAERLHVTQSAVSQRIKALEQRVGQVLVLRGKPCRATTVGVPLLRLAAQTAILESEALAELSGAGDAGQTRIALAVNADSMSTWFTRVFDRLEGVLFDIRIEDQDHSARLLREGVVMGAVTTERTSRAGMSDRVAGCDALRARCQQGLRETPSPRGFTAKSVATAPSLAWNRDDALQDMLIRKAFRRVISRPVHYVPTAEGFRAAVQAGLGWGMFPQQLARLGEADGSFVRIADVELDVPLYWQCWKLDSPIVATITAAVRWAAG